MNEADSSPVDGSPREAPLSGDGAFPSLRISIKGYRLLEELGRGGQGVVIRAHSLETNQDVALKILHLGISTEEMSRRRFDREQRWLSVLDHPGIVRLLDRGTTDQGDPFVAMELVPGRPLQRFLHDDALLARLEPDPTLLVRIFAKLCDAVGHAHRLGVVHRDLCPSNVLLDEQWEPHVIDFGLARTAFERFFETEAVPETALGSIFGKLRYASPEQLRGSAGAVDPRSDVYSLGVMLYEAWTGRLPYELRGDILADPRTIEATPPRRFAELPASRLTAGPSAAVEAICFRALAKRKEDRFGSAGEMAADLERCLAGEKLVAIPLPMLPGEVRKHRIWTHPAAVGVAIALVVGLWAWRSTREPRTPERPLPPALLERTASPAIGAPLQLLLGPADGPSPRWSSPLAYDPKRDRVVLFGGFDGEESLDDTWEWDGTHWTLFDPPLHPSARHGHALVFDPVSERVLLFGGACAPYCRDTWFWDGAVWTPLDPAAPAPSRRYLAAAGSTPALPGVVLFGGQISQRDFPYTRFLADLWHWNGTSWTLLAESTPVGARSQARMVYDSDHDHALVLVGGHGFDTRGRFYDDCWSFDGKDWREMSRGSFGPGRCSFAFVHVPSRNSLVLLGGIADDGPLEDAWELGMDGWKSIPVLGRPSALGFSDGIEVTSSGSAFFFGGFDGELPSGETWMVR